jgi:hypothetical protein
MAIKANTIKEKLETKLNEPLSKEELNLVRQTESYIDLIIEEESNKLGKEFRIDLDFVTFNSHPDGGNLRYSIHEDRRIKMRRELEKRYKEAGWKFSVDYGEDDGPNRPGFDYWVLKM